MKRDIYNEDHEAFRESARTWIERSVTPNAEKYIQEKSLPREFWLEAGAQGMLGLAIPEEYGGAGADDFRFNAVLTEEMAKVGAWMPTCVGIHADITAPYIVELGTEEQKQRWLPGVASGEILLGIGMTEPSGGSDLAALRTTAVRDGDEWVINGSKTFITNGYSGDLIVTAARTDPEKGPKGITLFGIEATKEGFSRGRKLDKVGMEESDTSELFFENVRCTDDDIIGELNMGFVHMMQKLPQERLACAIANTHHAKQILAETIQYAKDRQAFGQSIGRFQHIKFLLAELVTAVEVCEAYMDKCVAAHAEGQLSAVEAAKAKWWSSDMQNEVIDHCVQIHGGYGFMNEYRVARAWRDARVTKIWAGSNEIMKELIGRELGF
ncbi:acyl-CoA dehydrogenase family protein [Nocardioides bizhenqiangii]|uniref:Acyl-CoA dehydrogenase family protein n=1 Tax=Nocardioides bizhenqiangii TaxID=3095076 RepID=A0ABZ0ZPP7_9ACTN|nr:MULTISPECIES: acyl-CoA dehydrogenase family protein [unclassified Nocardioides]MDZ5619701.1 acyl-CoA dehydrogenase family protein [Nocardioides sp. HM23]WQQ26289.1 acyl-CoA dehydrogenase family protein [Nocardioides sp. HM61]